MKKLRAEIYPDRGGRYRWRLRASNGQVVAVSGESFASKSNAKRAFKKLIGRPIEGENRTWA